MADAEPLETVRAFLAAIGRGTRAELRDAYDAFMAEDCVYENAGLPTFHNKAETMAFFFSDMSETAGIVSIQVDLHRICANGDVVFTERTDHHLDASGADILPLKICGVFEVEDGRFRRWADYFDPGPMLRLFETRPIVGAPTT